MDISLRSDRNTTIPAAVKAVSARVGGQSFRGHIEDQRASWSVHEAPAAVVWSGDVTIDRPGCGRYTEQVSVYAVVGAAGLWWDCPGGLRQWPGETPAAGEHPVVGVDYDWSNGTGGGGTRIA